MFQSKPEVIKVNKERRQQAFRELLAIFNKDRTIGTEPYSILIAVLRKGKEEETYFSSLNPNPESALEEKLRQLLADKKANSTGASHEGYTVYCVGFPNNKLNLYFEILYVMCIYFKVPTVMKDVFKALNSLSEYKDQPIFQKVGEEFFRWAFMNWENQ